MVGKGTGPQHGQSLEAWLGHVPGLLVAMPATPADAYHLLRAAIRCDDPVVVLESLRQWNLRGQIADEEPLEVGRAAVRRPGADLTLVSVGGRAAPRRAGLRAGGGGGDRRRAHRPPLAVAAGLGLRGVLAAQDRPSGGGPRRGRFPGPGAELAARAVERVALAAPVVRVAPPRTPVPFAPSLEERYFPGAERIVAACRKVMGRSDG